MKASIEFSSNSGGQSGSKWPSIVIQGIALSVNVSFLLKGQSNTYFYASIVLILSLYVLQAIHRRFLMLYPVNIPLKRPSPHVDTFISRGFIWLSYLLLFFGIYSSSHPFFPVLQEVWLISFIVTGLLMLPLVFWVLSSIGFIQGLIAKQLSKKPFVAQLQNCPHCNSSNAEIRREIMTRTEMKEIISCSNCNGSEIIVPINIGD